MYVSSTLWGSATVPMLSFKMYFKNILFFKKELVRSWYVKIRVANWTFKPSHQGCAGAYYLCQKTVIHPAENIDCLSSLSFYCLFFELWLFFVFLLFLFVISALLFLFWTPSAKSWLSRMQGSVVLIFVFSWCSVFYFLIITSSKWFSILLLWPLLYVQLSARLYLCHGV